MDYFNSMSKFFDKNNLHYISSTFLTNAKGVYSISHISKKYDFQLDMRL